MAEKCKPSRPAQARAACEINRPRKQVENGKTTTPENPSNKKTLAKGLGFCQRIFNVVNKFLEISEESGGGCRCLSDDFLGSESRIGAMTLSSIDSRAKKSGAEIFLRAAP
jgi:hypothetical protein